MTGMLDAARHPLEHVAETLPAALPTQRHMASRYPWKQELVRTVLVYLVWWGVCDVHVIHFSESSMSPFGSVLYIQSHNYVHL